MKSPRQNLDLPLRLSELNEQLANTIRDIVGDEMIKVDLHGDTAVLRLSIPKLIGRLPAEIGVYKITGTKSGACGTYTLKEQLLNGTNADETTDLDISSTYTDGDNPTVIGVNLSETKNPTGTHWLQADGTKYVLARRTPRITASSSNSQVGNLYVEFDEAKPGGLFPVNLTQSGGSNGSASSTASYTYNATDAFTGNSISGGPFSVTWNRRNGLVNAATHGTGYYNSSGTFVLWEADEQIQTDTCS